MTIIEAIEDERFFRPLFRDLKTWHSWLIFLRALFGLPIEDKRDRRLFRKSTNLKSPPCKPAKESYVIAGRRSGKSFISALVAVYLACFKDWKSFLSPGERGHIFIIATDREQAKIIKNYISGILNSSPIFQRMINKELVWEIELANNVNIAVKTCNFKSVRGFTLLTAICEEVAFWRDENSANPAQEILNAIRPALSTIPDSLLIGISTPYSRSGLLWEQYRSHFGSREKEAPLIWKAPTLTMNPTIPKKEIDRAYRQDRSIARAEWDAEFREDIEAFLSLELIEQAVVPGRIELPRVEGVTYYGFCDPSGGRRDSMTLGVAHREERTGKIILDCLREARPPFVPKDVVREFSEVLNRYGISLIKSDRYAGEWVSSAFSDHQIMVENSELSASEIYSNFLPLISNGSVELLDSKRLISQLRGLERKARPGGKDLISHPQFSWARDDLAVVAAGSIVQVAKSESDENFMRVTEEVIRKNYENVEGELSEQEAWERRMMAFMLGKGDYATKEQRDKEAKGENPCPGKKTTHVIGTKWKW